jgi:hypothetical protein
MFIQVALLVSFALQIISFHKGITRPFTSQSNLLKGKISSSPSSSIRDMRMVATDTPKLDSSPMSGMFTNSSPETKRVIPTNLNGKTKFKIVYVVLESQYQSSLTKACNAINSGKEGVAVEAVGYLLEELRNPNVLEQFKADVADANIFIGSLIFVQELADKVIIYFIFECIILYYFYL